MTNQKTRRTVITIALFVIAGILILCSSITGARAALTYYSESYTARVATTEIGVALVENGTTVASDGEMGANLLAGMLDEGENLILDKAYPEAISVANTGEIDEFVRVTVTKYWVDEKGDKMTELDPALIELNLTGNGWVVDESASTAERTVLYYTSSVAAQGSTAPLSDTLTISGTIANKVTQTTEAVNGGTEITTVYDYDGVSFVVSAKVDAVQTHNAETAILSAWGRAVTVSGSSLSLS